MRPIYLYILAWNDDGGGQPDILTVGSHEKYDPINDITFILQLVAQRSGRRSYEEYRTLKAYVERGNVRTIVKNLNEVSALGHETAHWARELLAQPLLMGDEHA